MTKKTQRSSRKRMESRNHKRAGVSTKGHDYLVGGMPHPMGLAAIAAIVGGAMRNKTGGRGQ